MLRRELQALLADPYLQAAVNLTGTSGGQQTRRQRATTMADNDDETSELLQRVQHLVSCLQEAKSVPDERAAELELTPCELRRASNQAVEQREEAERQQGSVE